MTGVAMAEVLLNRPRRDTASGIGTALLAAWVIAFSILPAYAILHPEFVGVAEAAVSLLLLPIVVVAGFILAWRVFGREEIVADDDVLRVTRHLGPFNRKVAVALSDVQRVSVYPVGRREMQNDVFGIGHATLLLECVSSQVRCGITLGPGEAADLAGRIETLRDLRRRRTRG